MIAIGIEIEIEIEVKIEIVIEIEIIMEIVIVIEIEMENLSQGLVLHRIVPQLKSCVATVTCRQR